MVARRPANGLRSGGRRHQLVCARHRERRWQQRTRADHATRGHVRLTSREVYPPYHLPGPPTVEVVPPTLVASPFVGVAWAGERLLYDHEWSALDCEHRPRSRDTGGSRIERKRGRRDIGRKDDCVHEIRCGGEYLEGRGRRSPAGQTCIRVGHPSSDLTRRSARHLSLGARRLSKRVDGTDWRRRADRDRKDPRSRRQRRCLTGGWPPGVRLVGVPESVLLTVCDLPACTNRQRLPLPTNFSLGSSPMRWTPDSRSIAYVDTNGSNIWSQPLDGGPPRQITHFSDTPGRVLRVVARREAPRGRPHDNDQRHRAVEGIEEVGEGSG